MLLDRLHLAIISAGRPDSVHGIAAHFPVHNDQLTWYVREEDYAAYQAAGAAHVVKTVGLCRARNQALSDAFDNDKICLQMSDDFSRASQVLFGKPNTSKPITLTKALEIIVERFQQSSLKLAGVAPTHNPYFTQRRITTNGFIVGDFIVVKPTDIRFDENLRLKEDYDFTLQHWSTYGGALRNDDILLTFAHRTNRGGAVAYRNASVEADAINYLCKKWGAAIRINERRANEILLNWHTVLQKA